MKVQLTCVLVISLFCLGVPAAGELVFPDGSSMDTAPFDKTVLVKADGTDTQNGTALLQALSDITDAAADNRYVLQLEAGTYDMGSSTLSMKDFVHLEGAGMDSSTVTSTGGTTLRVDSLSARSSIRRLELVNASTSGFGFPADVSSGDVRFWRVRFRIESTSVQSAGLIMADGARRGSSNAGGWGAGSGSSRGELTPTNVNLRSCEIIAETTNASLLAGIVNFGTGHLNTYEVVVSVTGSTSTNHGIELWSPTTNILNETLVTAGPAPESRALYVEQGVLPQYVATFDCFFRGDTAMDADRNGNGSTQAPNLHKGTGFDGIRTGFTNGVTGFFALCYDQSAIVPVPLIDTSAAIAP